MMGGEGGGERGGVHVWRSHDNAVNCRTRDLPQMGGGGCDASNAGVPAMIAAFSGVSTWISNGVSSSSGVLALMLEECVSP